MSTAQDTLKRSAILLMAIMIVPSMVNPSVNTK